VTLDSGESDADYVVNGFSHSEDCLRYKHEYACIKLSNVVCIQGGQVEIEAKNICDASKEVEDIEKLIAED
jgi:hypothetical protein